MPRKGPLTGPAKTAFLKQMADGKRKAAQKRGGKTTRTRRKTNPALSKIDWESTLKTFGGVAGGAFVGYAVTDFIGDLLISKLPAGVVQGIGYALGGAGILIAGHMLQKEAKGWPITAASIAVAAPFALRAFSSMDWIPLGVQSTMAGSGGMGFFGRRRRVTGPRKCIQVPMQGTFSRNPMQGTFARNPMAGSMIADSPFAGRMGGTFMPEPRMPMRTRGGHGPTL